YNQPKPIKLAVVISVDQMRYDYFERFGDLFQHGLKELADKGTLYTKAYHEHSMTATAPGHATLSTGCYPMHHGIIENNFYNQKSKRTDYAVVDPNTKLIGGAQEKPGVSPKNLMRRALGDHVKKASNKSKVFSVAIKDRTSILLGGKKPNHAFWFDNGSLKFISSSHYGNTLPNYLAEMTAEKMYAAEMEKGWHKKLPEEAYSRSRADNFIFENGQFLPEFPHTKARTAGFIRPEMKNTMMMRLTPLGDKFVLDMAERIITEEGLGMDDETDVLFIGCSNADAIGHHFGPMSHEVQDYYLWLDQYIGEFIAYLDETVGRANYVLGLSADHGVLPMPEQLSTEGIDAKRIRSKDFGNMLDKVEKEVEAKLGVTGGVFMSAGSSGITPDYELTRAAGLGDKMVRAIVAEVIGDLDIVEEVFTLETLAKSTGEEIQELFRRSSYAQRGHHIKMRFKENYLVGYQASGTTHGSPYDYDQHVPILFFGGKVPAQKIDRKVATVDFAPTMARLMGLTPKDKMDGEILLEAVMSQ
ncbi:MAG: alkaline phosphatase family protein, partial [Saprospiraceae bacterium]|nr:alkaline phosphatase family protein [Saprospiraceae bacterium]